MFIVIATTCSVLIVIFVVLIFFSTITVVYGQVENEFLFSDKKSYHPGDTIVVSGTMNSQKPFLFIFLLDSDENIIEKFKVRVNENGKFTQLIPSHTLDDGIYAIYATSGGNRVYAIPIQIMSELNNVSLSTEYHLYKLGDEILVTITPNKKLNSETVARLYDSSDDIIFSKRIYSLDSEKTFAIPSEPFWKSGKYQLILYLDGVIQDKISFILSKDFMKYPKTIIPNELEKKFIGMFETIPYTIEYTFTGNIFDVDIDKESKSLIISLSDNNKSEKITLKLYRDLISEDNDNFIILVDKKIISYDIVESNTYYNIIEFPLSENSQTITITGNNIIPEFGNIVIMVLISSMIVIISLGKTNILK